jgi:hypothetical protein
MTTQVRTGAEAISSIEDETGEFDPTSHKKRLADTFTAIQRELDRMATAATASARAAESSKYAPDIVAGGLALHAIAPGAHHLGMPGMQFAQMDWNKWRLPSLLRDVESICNDWRISANFHMERDQTALQIRKARRARIQLYERLKSLEAAQEADLAEGNAPDPDIRNEIVRIKTQLGAG